MRVLTLLLILVAVGISVYNTLELRRLRAEVAQLRATGSTGAAAGDPAADARARELLRRSSEHSKRAQELLRAGKLEEANRELQKSLELKAEAAEAAGRGDVVAEIRDSAGKTAQRVEELISRLKRKPAPSSP